MTTIAPTAVTTAPERRHTTAWNVWIGALGVGLLIGFVQENVEQRDADAQIADDLDLLVGLQRDLGQLGLSRYHGLDHLHRFGQFRQGLFFEQLNRAAQWRNEQLASEVRDLQEGQDMVEELARQELGMVKPNEIFVQIAR